MKNVTVFFFVVILHASVCLAWNNTVIPNKCQKFITDVSSLCGNYSPESFQERDFFLIEISWIYGGIRYSGVLQVSLMDREAFFTGCYHVNGVHIYVIEKCSTGVTYDVYGNRTVWLTGWVVQTKPQTPYYPRRFMICPDGSVYTQDIRGGGWIRTTSRYVPSNEWESVSNKYDPPKNRR